MRQLPHDARLSQKALTYQVIVDDFRPQCLDGKVAIEPGIVGSPNLSHASSRMQFLAIEQVTLRLLQAEHKGGNNSILNPARRSDLCARRRARLYRGGGGLFSELAGHQAIDLGAVLGGEPAALDGASARRTLTRVAQAEHASANWTASSNPNCRANTPKSRFWSESRRGSDPAAAMIFSAPVPGGVRSTDAPPGLLPRPEIIPQIRRFVARANRRVEASWRSWILAARAGWLRTTNC